MENVYLLIGGNLGDREKNLQNAVVRISEKIGIIEYQSSVYESAAWGKTNQPDFLNQALVCKTLLPPLQVLTQINFIEDTFGRDRTEKWGARTMDIDILFYANQILNDSVLTIPHPLLQERKFTLAPLNEIVPEYTHPVLNKSIAQLYVDCADISKVWKYEMKQEAPEYLLEEFSYSLDYLKGIAKGDGGFVKKMLAVYAVQTPINVATLAKAISENDFETTAQMAHKMKPTFMMFGVNNVNTALAAIEKNASQNNSMPKIAKIFDEMLPVIDEVYEKWQEDGI